MFNKSYPVIASVVARYSISGAARNFVVYKLVRYIAHIGTLKVYKNATTPQSIRPLIFDRSEEPHRQPQRHDASRE